MLGLYAERETFLAVLWGVCVLVALTVAGVMCVHRPGPPRDVVRLGADVPRTEWLYLLVCNECAHRARYPVHPTQEVEQRGLFLQCPDCGEFTAAAYRRGGMVMPPGGWMADDDDESGAVATEVTP